MIHTTVADNLVQLVPAMKLDCSPGMHANGLDLPAIGINLDGRPDKWRMLSSRMASIGLDKLIRAPAIHGKSLPDDLVAELLGYPTAEIEAAPDDHLRLTRPAIGCFLSHLSVWKWVVANNIDRAIVFEDDAMPAHAFDPHRFFKTITSLTPDKSLVFLGRSVMHGMAEIPERPSLARLYYFNGTFAYLITREACRHLLRALLPMHAHIDHQMSRLFVEQRDSFPVWHAEPSFFEPDWSLGSDCFVALSDESAADRELNALLNATRATLLAEGRALAAR